MLEENPDYGKLMRLLDARIRFYQHERLIHLIITMTFALMVVMSIAVAVVAYPLFAAVTVLFLALEIPYIMHYYFLENSVQSMYKVYYRLQELTEQKK